jgi:hypothetical protein
VAWCACTCASITAVRRLESIAATAIWQALMTQIDGPGCACRPAAMAGSTVIVIEESIVTSNTAISTAVSTRRSMAAPGAARDRAMRSAAHRLDP